MYRFFITKTKEYVFRSKLILKYLQLFWNKRHLAVLLLSLLRHWKVYTLII